MVRYSKTDIIEENIPLNSPSIGLFLAKCFSVLIFRISHTENERLKYSAARIFQISHHRRPLIRDGAGPSKGIPRHVHSVSMAEGLANPRMRFRWSP